VGPQANLVDHHAAHRDGVPATAGPLRLELLGHFPHLGDELATSTVRGALNDAASRAANGRAGEAELARLADDAERSLGPMGGRTTILLRLEDDDADGVPDVVVGSALADPPRFVPPGLSGVAGLDDIDVSVRVRIERFR
jgi:hypothetical protein